MKILTWNISYGYGLGSEGASKAYEPKARFQYESALLSLSQFIQNVNPDIVLLQEVDFDSKRSHHQNQLEFLARSTGLIYYAELISWNVPYLPYPGLNPKRHFGKVVSGGGILSRKPIRTIQKDLLPKPREFHPIYRKLYLHRYLQIVETFDLKICNLHLEAFSEDNRDLHLIKLQNRLIDYDIDIAGGDFNGNISLTADTEKTWEGQSGSAPTFPADHPDQTLDGFVFKRERFKAVSAKTLDSGTVSDHLPVLFEG